MAVGANIVARHILYQFLELFLIALLLALAQGSRHGRGLVTLRIASAGLCRRYYTWDVGRIGRNEVCLVNLVFVKERIGF